MMWLTGWESLPSTLVAERLTLTGTTGRNAPCPAPRSRHEGELYVEVQGLPETEMILSGESEL